MTDADKPTPESERGDILRDDDGNPPKLREVASFGFWAAVVLLLAVAVARC